MIELFLTAALRTLVTGILAESAFRLLRVHHPVFRKAVWACVLLTGFAMPLLQARSVLIRLPLLQDRAAALPQAITTGFQFFSTAPPTRSAGPVVSAAYGHLLMQHLSVFSAFAVLAYLLVAGVLLLRVAMGIGKAWRLLVRSEALPTAGNCSVRISTEIATPWTFGSSILLPEEATKWDEEQLRLVLAHETSHVQQFDFYLQLAARLYAAVFWFSPLGWWLLRECERLGEQTSDHAALSATNNRRRYADLLVHFSTDSALPAVCMARRSGVATRIESMLAVGSLNRLFHNPLRAAACAAIVALLSIFAGACRVGAQAKATGEPAKPTVPFQTFDIVSIKPANPANRNMTMRFDGTILHATNMSVTVLLMNAYGIRPGMIASLPKWAENARYDVEAKISEPNPAYKDRKLPQSESGAIWHARVQALLADNFHLKVHYETFTAPVYNLVLTSGGPKFKASTVPEDKEMMNVNSGLMEANRIPVSSLCEGLADMVERNVIDKTGLTGNYDMKLTWTPEEQANTAKDSGIANPAPDIYTALQEQLGLKLVPAKGPVRKLVVDSIEPPALN